MKRFVVCFDGTWQSLHQKRLTNIGTIARSVAHKTQDPQLGTTVEQFVIYSRGVGSGINALDRNSWIARLLANINTFFAGAFGDGAEDQIVDAYLRLAFNYEAGDEIYVFGFSRGAFAARSFAGLINCSGILSRMHVERAWEAFALYREQLPDKATEEQIQAYHKKRADFRYAYGKGARAEDGQRVKRAEPPSITYLGIFDTVVQRGFWSVLLGLKNLSKRYRFHNLHISPNVQSARHAIAIDEYRRGFPLRPWEDLHEDNARIGKPDAFQQRWFVGAHGDIGGGEGSLLSAAPLKWVARGAADCGLRFYGAYGADESELHRNLREAGIDEENAFAIKSDGLKISRPNFFKGFSPHNWDAGPRQIWAPKYAPSEEEIDATLDPSVLVYFMAKHVKPHYEPIALRRHRLALSQRAARYMNPEQMRKLRTKYFFFF